MTAINGVASTIGHMAAAPRTDTPAGPGSTEADAPAPSPSGGRRERKVLETRRAILDAARRLFEADGYAETTVERIAEAADVAPRTFFRYFPTKESLLFADFDEVRRTMLDRLDARPADEDPIVSIAAALRWMAGALGRHDDDIAWGFRICTDQVGEGTYDKTMMREDSNARVAAFIADRLGVDPDTDARPLAWSMAIMGVFSAAMKSASAQRRAGGPDTGVETFERMLRSTIEMLGAAADALPDAD
jgi:AcrR family transcriptional regulator